MGCHFPAVNETPFLFFLQLIFIFFACNQTFFLIGFFINFRLCGLHKIRESHNRGCNLALIWAILRVIFSLRSTSSAFFNILCFVFSAWKPLISCSVRHVVWNVSIKKNRWQCEIKDTYTDANDCWNNEYILILTEETEIVADLINAIQVVIVKKTDGINS